MKINEIFLEGTLDTGASASVCSTSVYDKFLDPPIFIKSKTLHSAGQNQTVQAKLVGPVRISIGHLLLFKNIYVAPIQDEFLLGLDLLLEIQGKIDIGKAKFYCHNYPVPIKKVEMSRSSAAYAQVLDDIAEEVLTDDPPTSSKSDTADQSKVNVGPEYQSLPERLHCLYDSVDESVSAADKEVLKNLLIEFQDIFAKDEYDVGSFTGISHKIELSDTIPVKLNMRRTPWQLVEEEASLIEKLLKAKIIQPSTSSYASAPVMIRKKNGGLRYCLDYRLLNSKTIKDTYPLPLLADCVDALSGNAWFSKLDCNNAYHQIPVHPESKDKTAFRTRLGLFEFNKLPFGLCNATSTYSRAIDLVLRGLTWKSVLCFLDDVCVLGLDIPNHLDNLRSAFERFRLHGMKLKPSKCELFQKRMTFLGRLVSPQGVTITNHAKEVISKWKEPSTLKELQSFLGFANFHRSFIKNFSGVAAPMFAVLKGKNKKQFFWGPDQATSFKQLCNELMSPAVLAMPQKEGRLYLDCDASIVAIGAELWQLQDGVKRVLSFGSFALSKAQRAYCTTRLELLAVVRFCLFFKNALLAQEFTVTTDHFALKWLMNFKNLEGQLARWVEILSQFNMVIEHKPGRHHQNADALSRRPVDDPCLIISDPKLLPCGGCKHCLKVHEKWALFEAQVNDVINLADRAHSNASSPPKDSSEEIMPIRTLSQDENSNLPNSLGDNWIEIASLQKEDPNLNFLYQFLLNGEQPSEQEVKFSHPAAQFYYNNKGMFSLVNEVIFKTEGVPQKLLLVPFGLKDEVLRLCHDIPTSGHLGISKTKIRLQQRYFWHKQSKDIANYVLSCHQCNLNKSANRPAKHPRVTDHAGFPLQKVHMDHLGPLPVTDNNNLYVLVIVDNFSKWVECLPVPDITAEITAKAAVNHFFSRFGFPNQIVTDQHQTFESQLFSEMCKLLHIKKSRTSGYRPSANGQAESKNRVLMSAIRCFVDKNHKDWDIYVPLVASALRSAVNRHTGYTPNELMLGRQLNTPADLVFPDNHISEISPDQYIVQLRKNMELAHNVAREYLKVQLKITKKNNDAHVKLISYSPGDIVFFLNRKPKNKLKPKWIGPAIVTKVFSPQTIEINLKARVPKVVSHDYLKPCLDKTLPRWITKIQKEITSETPRKFCICNQEDDGSVLIQCDICQEWFHIRCFNLSHKQAKELKTFECPDCVNQN